MSYKSGSFLALIKRIFSCLFIRRFCFPYKSIFSCPCVLVIIFFFLSFYQDLSIPYMCEEYIEKEFTDLLNCLLHFVKKHKQANLFNFQIMDLSIFIQCKLISTEKLKPQIVCFKGRSIRFNTFFCIS